MVRLMNTMKKWCMTGCFVFLCLIMGSIFLRFFTVQIFVKRMHMDNPVIQAILFDDLELKSLAMEDIKIDWAGLYPFPASSVREGSPRDIDKIAKFDAIIHGVKNIVDDKISRWTSDHLMGYGKIIETYNLYKKILQWNIMARKEYNSVVEIEDGQLTEFQDREDMSERIKNTMELDRFCKDNGSAFLFVLAPGKIDRHEEKYRTLDFSNANADAFVSGLKANGVDYVDIRENMDAEGLTAKDVFFRTDHHWMPEAGLWATGIVARYLNEKGLLQSDVSLLEPQMWDKEVYKNFFLGSRGKKITLVRTAPDDITIYHPKWPTHLHMEIPNRAIVRDGDFEITYNKKLLEELDYYHMEPYGAYSWSNMPYKYIRNDDAGNDETVLFLKNSFGNVVYPFLSLQFKHAYELDIRAFTGSVHEFIRQKKPNVVIVLYSVNFLDRAMKIEYRSHTSPWDFR